MARPLSSVHCRSIVVIGAGSKTAPLRSWGARRAKTKTPHSRFFLARPRLKESNPPTAVALSARDERRFACLLPVTLLRKSHINGAAPPSHTRWRSATTPTRPCCGHDVGDGNHAMNKYMRRPLQPTLFLILPPSFPLPVFLTVTDLYLPPDHPPPLLPSPPLP